MPAYNGVIREKDLEDLIAYYKAVAVYESMPKNVGDGHAVAARYGCFGCHGPGGRVGARNPGSFKGYIPPWQGDDFSELVKNDQELRRWILDGSIDRIDSNRIARFFVRRQVIKMPAYRDIMREDELTTLVSYINWLQTIR
jgi:hypothetical protein